MKTELKPCPFCGGEAGKYADEQTAIVWCKNCDASVFDDNLDSAAARWNRRPITKLISAFRGLEKKPNPDIMVTECCSNSPITNEKYCPNCGKEIIR